MLFTGPIYTDENRYVHSAVYGVTESIPEFMELSKDRRSWVAQRVRRYDPEDDLSRAAARVSYIYTRVTNNWLAAIRLLSGTEVPEIDSDYLLRLNDVVIPHEAPELTGEQLERCLSGLYNLLHCTPNQGVGISPQRTGNCDLYRMCPWCRYKKTRELFLTLLPYLSSSKKLAVTSFMTPMEGMSSEYFANSDAHSVIGEAIQKNRDWICDILITLPYRVYLNDGDSEMFWRTSLVAVAEEDKAVPSIEDLSPSSIPGARMISDGTVCFYKPTLAGLSAALRPVMGYPGWPLRHEHNRQFLCDLARTLIPRDVFRMATHGIRAR